jgi:hypothetical protein
MLVCVRVCGALSGEETMPWTRFSCGCPDQLEYRLRVRLGERPSETVSLLWGGKPFAMRAAMHVAHERGEAETKLELQAARTYVLCHEDVERITQAVLAHPPRGDMAWAAQDTSPFELALAAQDTSPFDLAWVAGKITAVECEAARDDERVASKLLAHDPRYFKFLSPQCRDTETLALPAVHGCEENLPWASVRLRRLLAPTCPAPGSE